MCAFKIFLKCLEGEHTVGLPWSFLERALAGFDTLQLCVVNQQKRSLYKGFRALTLVMSAPQADRYRRLLGFE